MNTKVKGNKAESVILSELVKQNIPVMIPFGDNEKYDFVIDLHDSFKSVQVKYGTYANGCITADIRHRIGAKRIKYETYAGKVDYIGIWCEAIDKSYLVPILFANKTVITLRIDKPKNNSVKRIVWAKDYELVKIIHS